jgi:fermentation-respiration switch protein FrsA (DUF1100 family)
MGIKMDKGRCILLKEILSRIGLIGIIVLTLITLFPREGWCNDFERRDVTFKSQGLDCAAWYYLPKDVKAGEKRPAIVMANGLSAVKEMGLDKFAEKFAEAGFVVLVFDYRYFGASGGETRGQFFYYDQQQDYRNAITWVSLQKEVDSQRVGLWGTSFSGGHVLHLAAFDKRVKAVVAQVPATYTWETYYQNAKPEALAGMREWFAKNRSNEYTTGIVQYIPVVAPEGQPSCLSQKESFEWFTEAAKTAPNWENKVTAESIDINKEYAPMAYIHIISPTPLLMIVADHDNVCPTDVQKRGFALAGEPKQLVVVEGSHFSVYHGTAFVKASTSAVDWFKKYLKP